MYTYKAEIKRIIDGDTVDLRVDLGFNVWITIRARLLGVNTPERGHEDFHKASRMLGNLLNKNMYKYHPKDDLDHGDVGYILIKTEKTGKYGRWLVEIDNVNSALAKIWPYE